MDVVHDTPSKAVPLFEQAIKLDPNFALAFAGLSIVESWIYHSTDPTATLREKARLNADEALRLQPDLPEGHLALGFSYYYGDRDYERALSEFEIAKRGLPSNAAGIPRHRLDSTASGEMDRIDCEFGKSGVARSEKCKRPG
jgi:tetratricopeptide (TPR) repeat protein